MKAERYRQIDKLFEEAMDRRPVDRGAFLDAACADDDDLRNQVESLLRAYEKIGNFIEDPAMNVAARAAAGDAPPSRAGHEIGPYRIVSLLGAGGMGEVYLAEDARLGRKVALKLLPDEFTKDAERVSRFEREARAASALNHPNIITIYEIGRIDDTHFIATEFIDGQTLRQRQDNGRIDIKEAIDLAVQISSALAEAHSAGIVHRDIKPENIMLRRDGYVKVLDFGLAKLTEDKSSDGAQDWVTTAQTAPGTVMGTINYMSPEQALGQKLDCRTDIFSVGVVLCEMVTGENPFKGGSMAATFDAILNRAPSTVSNADLPVELGRIISRALEKDRELRYQTASDLRAALKRLTRDIDSSPSIAAPAAHQSRWLKPLKQLSGVKKTVIAVVFIAVAVLAGLLVLKRGTEVERKSGTPVIRSAVPVTDAAGEELFPSLSPDGKFVVYVKRATGNLDIYQQRVGGKNPVNLTADSLVDDTQPAFSPDGERIAFRSEREGGGVFIMGASGESARRLTDFGYNPSWSRDGKQIAFATQSAVDAVVRGNPQSQLWAVDVATNEKRLLTEGDAVQPSWSPNGHRIAYWLKHKGGQRDVWTASSTRGDPVQVTDDVAEDWNPVWSPDGEYLYFVSMRSGNMNVWRVRIDEQTGKVLSSPEPITLPSSSAQHICLSRDGRKMAYVQMLVRRNVQTLEVDPVNEKVLGAPVWVTQGTRNVTSVKLSPDGEWFAHDSIGEMQFDIFVMRKDGTGERNLTQDAHKDLHPQWSPDGERIAFYSDRSGTYQIWTIKPDGSGLQQMTFVAEPGVIYPVWSPDGTRLAYSGSGYSDSSIIDLRKPWSEQTPESVAPMVERDSIFIATHWSPDGKRLVGTGFEASTRRSIGTYVYWIEAQRFEKVCDIGTTASWLSDNRRIIITYQNKLYVVDSQAKKPRELFSAAPHEVNAFKISSDDRMIYYTIGAKEADVWLATLE